MCWSLLQDELIDGFTLMARWAHFLQEAHSILVVWWAAERWKEHEDSKITWKVFPPEGISWMKSSKQMMPASPGAPQFLCPLSKGWFYSWLWLVHVSTWIPRQTSDLEIPRSQKFPLYCSIFMTCGGVVGCGGVTLSKTSLKISFIAIVLCTIKLTPLNPLDVYNKGQGMFIWHFQTTRLQF